MRQDKPCFDAAWGLGQQWLDDIGGPLCYRLGMAIDYSDYIIQDPQICGGEPVVRSTRVTVRTVRASLAEGATVQEILEDFPSLTEESVRAVIQSGGFAS